MPEFRKLIEYTVSASIIGVLVFLQSLIFNSPIFADDMQVAGNGVSQIRHGNKIVAGDQQRTGLTKRKNGQRYKQQNHQ